MIIILISFLNLSLRGVSHAEAQRNIEHAERKVSRRFDFLNAPAAPRPSRGGVAVGRGGVCIFKGWGL